MPENLMSRNTIKNVEKNKERIDYCVTTFSYISNRCHFCAPACRASHSCLFSELAEVALETAGSSASTA